MKLFSAKQLSFKYPLGTQEVQALSDVTFELERGGFYAVMGPSGSGKTTLLNLLGLIEDISGGSLQFGDIEMRGLSEEKRNELRRFHFGFVFQSFLLMDVLTAEENVAYFLARQNLTKKERGMRVARALEQVGLAAFAKKTPPTMSGGQRQRVAIARALAKNPAVIIADEPTANLDQKTASDILDLLQQLVAAGETNVVMASHDPLVAKRATRIVLMRDGRLVEGSV